MQDSNKTFRNLLLFLLLFTSFVDDLGSFTLLDVLLMLLQHLLELGFKIVVDSVELRSLGQMDHQHWLQLSVSWIELTLAFNSLNRLSLDPGFSAVFVLDQALSDQQSGEVGVGVHSVQLNGVELVLQDCLRSEHDVLEVLALSNHDHIVPLGEKDWLSFLVRLRPLFASLP